MVLYHSNAKAPPPPIPTDMVPLMKALAKRVLKEKPDNIYEFAARFFEELLIQRDGSLDKGYGRFRSYRAYCEISEKMNERAALKSRQRRVLQDDGDTDSGVASGASYLAEGGAAASGLAEEPATETVLAAPMEVCGTAIAAVPRQPPKNASKVRPTQSTVESIAQAPVLAKPKVKPRKLSSKKPADDLIAITEETSADVADTLGGTARQVIAARRIQKAFRRYRCKRVDAQEVASQMWAATVIQRAYRGFGNKKLSGSTKAGAAKLINPESNELPSNNSDDITERSLSALLLKAKQRSIQGSIDSNSYEVESTGHVSSLEPNTNEKLIGDDIQDPNSAIEENSLKKNAIESVDSMSESFKDTSPEMIEQNIVNTNIQTEKPSVDEFTPIDFENSVDPNSAVEENTLTKIAIIGSSMSESLKNISPEIAQTKIINNEKPSIDEIISSELENLLDPNSSIEKNSIKKNAIESVVLMSETLKNISPEIVEQKIVNSNINTENPLVGEIKPIELENALHPKDAIQKNTLTNNIIESVDSMSEPLKNISPDIIDNKIVNTTEKPSVEEFTPKDLENSVENSAEIELSNKDNNEADAKENLINTKSISMSNEDGLITKSEITGANNQCQDVSENVADLTIDPRSNESIQAGVSPTDNQEVSEKIINIDQLMELEPKPEAIAVSIVDDILDRIEVIEEPCVQKFIRKLVDDDDAVDDAAEINLTTEDYNIIDESSIEKLSVVNKNMELPAILSIDKSIIDDDNNTLSTSETTTVLAEKFVANITAEIGQTENKDSILPVLPVDEAQLVPDKIIETINANEVSETTAIQNLVKENDAIETTQTTLLEPDKPLDKAVENIDNFLNTSVNDEHQDDGNTTSTLAVKSVDENLLVASPLTLPDDNDVSEQSNPSTVIEVNATDLDHDNLADPFGQIVDTNNPPPLAFHKPTAAMLSDRRHTIATIAEDLSEHIFDTDDVRDTKTAPELLQSLPEEVPYEPLLSSGEQSDSTVATTDEATTAESSNESMTTSKDGEHGDDDMSDVENVDLSSYGEDSLEAMYYSLRKNEIVLDKMQNRRNVIMGKSDRGSQQAVFDEKELQAEPYEAVDGIETNPAEEMVVKTNDIPDDVVEVNVDIGIKDSNRNNSEENTKKEAIEPINKVEQKDDIQMTDQKPVENKIEILSEDTNTIDLDLNGQQMEIILDEQLKKDEKELNENQDGKLSDEIKTEKGKIETTIDDKDKIEMDEQPKSDKSEINTNLDEKLRDEMKTDELDSNIMQPIDLTVTDCNTNNEAAGDLENDENVNVYEPEHLLLADQKSSMDHDSVDAAKEISEPERQEQPTIDEDTLVIKEIESTSTENAFKKASEIADDLPLNQSINNITDEASSTENPIEFAMHKQRELLDRMHGSIYTDDTETETGSVDHHHFLHPYDRHPDIQRNMWTSSVSETDSDYVDLGAQQRRLVKDDFNISTAYGHTANSTSSSSAEFSSDSQTATTIVSAVTRIQAGARGFLARRRLRRSSVATTVVDASMATQVKGSQHQGVSFGNAAIDESLEAMVERNERLTLENAARIIQRFYRRRLQGVDSEAEHSTTIDDVSNTVKCVGHNVVFVQLDGSSSQNAANITGVYDDEEAHAVVEDDADENDADDADDNNADEDNNDIDEQQQQRIAENTIRVSLSPASHQYDVLEAINIAANDAHNVPTNQLSIVGVESSFGAGNIATTTTTATLLAVATPPTADDVDDVTTTTAAASVGDGSRRLDSEEAHQQRRLMLQRGDAVQRNSTPDEGDNDGDGSNGGGGNKVAAAAASIDAKAISSTTAVAVIVATDASPVPPTNGGGGGGSTVVRIVASKSNNLMRRRLLGMRQNSMPVQIDSEFIRIIPKHLRKRIKSADSVKKANK